LQHPERDEDRCLHQRRQVQRVAGPRVDQLYVGWAFLDVGELGLLHPIDQHLPDPPAKPMNQSDTSTGLPIACEVTGLDVRPSTVIS
jgi:hypothetical protein